jgi:hypothetical protein
MWVDNCYVKRFRIIYVKDGKVIMLITRNRNETKYTLEIFNKKATMFANLWTEICKDESLEFTMLTGMIKAKELGFDIEEISFKIHNKEDVK